MISTEQSKWMLPLSLLAFAVIVVGLLIMFAPQPKKRFKPPQAQIDVELELIEAKSLTPLIESYGLVEPRTKSQVVAQVGGRIEFIAERFRDGGFFNKGDTLVKIEASDYEIEVQIAEANLAEAQKRFAEEDAAAQQAQDDWKNLSLKENAASLVLRKPQLNAAQANLLAAQARLKKAKLNLDRTTVTAPFNGRVLTMNASLGEIANTNSTLGEIYASDAIEIRLPIKSAELKFLNLPESLLSQETQAHDLPEVSIISNLSGLQTWQGHIVRTSGSIDSASRQLYVVARIDDPFGEKAKGRFPLKIGQYVTAKITGNTIDEALSIPNKALYQGRYVYTYQNGTVQRQDINIAWQNDDYTVLQSGINSGSYIVTSPMGQAISGTPVNALNGPENTSEAVRQQSKVDLSRIPPERLAKLKARAEEEGISLEEMVKRMQARRASGNGARP